MIEFVPFRAGHLRFLKPQEAQRRDYNYMMKSDDLYVLEDDTALSAWVNQRCIGAAGLVQVRPHKAMAWLILSEDAAPYMLPIARKIRRVFRASPYKRVELSVADDFPNGDRFANLIGAVCETPEPMKFYGADGRDERMYALIKEA